MALLQEIAAGALVLVSAVYAAWRLAPVRVRLRLLDRIASTPGVVGRDRWLAKLRSRALEAGGGGGGGCSGCGAREVRPRSGVRTRTPDAPPH